MARYFELIVRLPPNWNMKKSERCQPTLEQEETSFQSALFPSSLPKNFLDFSCCGSAPSPSCLPASSAPHGSPDKYLARPHPIYCIYDSHRQIQGFLYFLSFPFSTVPGQAMPFRRTKLNPPLLIILVLLEPVLS